MPNEPLFYIGDDKFPVFQYLPATRRYERNARADIEALERRVLGFILPAIGVFIGAMILAVYWATFENPGLTQASLGAVVLAGAGVVWVSNSALSRRDSAKKLQEAIREGKERDVLVTPLDYCSVFAFTKEGKLRRQSLFLSLTMPLFLASPEMQEADRTLRQPVELTAEAIEARFRTKMRVIDWARITLKGGAYLDAIEREAVQERDELFKQAKEQHLEKMRELAEEGRALSRRS